VEQNIKPKTIRSYYIDNDLHDQIKNYAAKLTDNYGRPLSTSLIINEAIDKYLKQATPKTKTIEPVNDVDKNLSNQLVSYIEMHTQKPGPNITKTWLTDMRLLREQGPLGTKKEPLNEEQIKSFMQIVFEEMNEPSDKGFCWADQINSPKSIRKHLPKIRQSYKSSKTRNRSNHETTSLAKNLLQEIQ